MGVLTSLLRPPFLASYDPPFTHGVVTAPDYMPPFKMIPSWSLTHRAKITFDEADGVAHLDLSDVRRVVLAVTSDSASEQAPVVAFMHYVCRISLPDSGINSHPLVAVPSKRGGLYVHKMHWYLAGVSYDL